MVTARLKTKLNKFRRIRNSSSAKSYAPAMVFAIHNATGLKPTLSTLPVEIQDNIVSFLPQSSLVAMALTSSHFVGMVNFYLYMTPEFASTFRYAQFAYLVSHKPEFAGLVRELDLSYFGLLGRDEEGTLLPLAGWRDFKYKHYEMYYDEDEVKSHPRPSPFLKSFHRTRDLPIGGLCHVLAACKKIRKLNLSRLQLASDFLLTFSPFPSTPSPAHPSPIPATSTSGLLFVSDVPESFHVSPHPPNPSMVPVYADFVVSYLLTLHTLSYLKIKTCLWLTTSRVDTLMLDAGPQLVKVDFRGSGFRREEGWAVKGSRKMVEQKVGEGLGRFNWELYGVPPPAGLRGVPAP